MSRRAESRVNEAFAVSAREEFAAIRPLELRPEVLRQYSPLGRFELGEHGENFAAAVWQLEQDARHSRIRRVRGDDGELGQEIVRDQASQERWDAITSWISELTPRTIQSLRTIRSPTGEVIFAVREDRYKDPVAAPSLSDGTLRFAALTFATVGAEKRTTLVVEELENGISPTRLNLLISMIEQSAEASARPANTSGRDQEQDKSLQVIMSTHSPGILDYASLKTIGDSVVIGWDHETMSSHPINISSIPNFDQVTSRSTLGELQAEGWLQVAADI